MNIAGQSLLFVVLEIVPRTASVSIYLLLRLPRCKKVVFLDCALLLPILVEVFQGVEITFDLWLTFLLRSVIFHVRPVSRM